MRNFQTADDPTTYLTDEDGNYLFSDDGVIMASGPVTMTNVWGDEELQAGLFIDMRFPSADLNYSNFDIDLYHGATKYDASDMTVSSMEFASDMSVDETTVSLQNVDLTLSAVMLDENPIGSMATIYIGAVHSSRRIYELEPLIVGELSGWTINEKTAQLTFSGLMVRWNKKTLRVSQSSCPWPIGSTECGYAGSETCSQLYNRCNALSNSANFGGFTYIPDLMERKIYWGHLPP